MSNPTEDTRTEGTRTVPSQSQTDGTITEVTTAEVTSRLSLRRFVLGGLLVALLLAGGVSLFASANPDGLDSVTRAGCAFDAADEVVAGTCVAQQVRKHGLEGSPFAGYATQGVEGSASTAISGVVGVIVTLGVAFGMTLVLRRRTSSVHAGQASVPAQDR